MAKIWKIVAHPKPKAGEAPVKEYYLVAVGDQRSAAVALRLRRAHLEDAELQFRGEASPDFVEWVGGMKDGEILCVAGVQPSG